MSGVIPRNLKKNDVSISNRFPEIHKYGIHTHARTHALTHARTHTRAHTQTHTHSHSHTHTHDDIIKRNAMRCFSPKKLINI